METIKCQLCGIDYGQITEKHTKKCGGITIEEYRKKFPNSPIRTESHSNIIRKINSIHKRGDKNPMKNPEYKKKMMENQIIAVQNVEYRKRVSERQKISNNNPKFGMAGKDSYWYGKKKTKDVIDKMKKTMVEKYGKLKFDEKFKPNYNPFSCDVFDEISKITGTKIIHAKNSGEFYIKSLGYWVDGYDSANNIVYEWDEIRKFYPNGGLKEKHLIREDKIKSELNCKIIRIQENQFYSKSDYVHALRDIMDSIIEIKKENGFSNVRF